MGSGHGKKLQASQATGPFERFSRNPCKQAAPMYSMGHPDELIPRFQARIDAGVQELTFNQMAPDPTQLDLFMKSVRPHLRPKSPLGPEATFSP
jgi:hypothetical protein